MDENIYHIADQIVQLHIKPSVNKPHRLSDVIGLSALQSGKYFHPFSVAPHGRHMICSITSYIFLIIPEYCNCVL